LKSLAQPAYRARRDFGDLIESWIYDRLLVEVLPLSWARAYRQLLASGELRGDIKSWLSTSLEKGDGTTMAVCPKIL